MSCKGIINYLSEDGSMKSIEVVLPTSNKNEVTLDLIIESLHKDKSKLEEFSMNYKMPMPTPLKVSYLDTLTGKNVAGNTTYTELVDNLGLNIELGNLVNPKDAGEMLFFEKHIDSNIRSAYLLSKDGKETYMVSNNKRDIYNLLAGIELKQTLKTELYPEFKTKFLSNINQIFKNKKQLDNVKARRIKKVLKDINLNTAKGKENFINYMLFDTQFNHEIAKHFPKEHKEFIKNISDYIQERSKLSLDSLSTLKNNNELSELIRDSSRIKNNRIHLNINKIKDHSLFKKYDFTKDTDVLEAVKFLNNNIFKLNGRIVNLKIDYRTKDDIVLIPYDKTNKKPDTRIVVNSDYIKNSVFPVEEYNGFYIYPNKDGYLISDHIHKDFNELNTLYKKGKNRITTEKGVNHSESYSNALKHLITFHSNADFESNASNIKKALYKLNPESESILSNINYNDNIIIKSNNLDKGDIIFSTLYKFKDSNKTDMSSLLKNVSYSEMHNLLYNLSAHSESESIQGDILDLHEKFMNVIKDFDNFNVFMYLANEHIDDTSPLSNNIKSMSNILDDIAKFDLSPVPFIVVDKSSDHVQLRRLAKNSQKDIYTKKYNNIRRIHNNIISKLNEIGKTTTLINNEDMAVIADYSHRDAYTLPSFIYNGENTINGSLLNNSSMINTLLPIFINNAYSESQIDSLVDHVNKSTKSKYKAYVNRLYNGVDSIDSKIMYLSEALNVSKNMNSISESSKIDVKSDLSMELIKTFDLSKPLDIAENLMNSIDNILIDGKSNMLDDAQFARAFDSNISYYNYKTSSLAKKFLDVYGVKNCI